MTYRKHPTAWVHMIVCIYMFMYTDESSAPKYLQSTKANAWSMASGKGEMESRDINALRNYNWIQTFLLDKFAEKVEKIKFSLTESPYL